ncbi:Glutathione-dependent formaldehyde-activating family GFA [Macrophomina phaseolina MS6]|uniref:Glutathione-dependent formaldehyde-activating family GFA n=1 Tax=Macrophomina phaseolina (strain MS6) TaxID=1126212 RepID=K2SAE5_MACPH|nr:Glutathione-dependent formaldehyde-activating family GFA [Macrophomina phaseolina MS6]
MSSDAQSPPQRPTPSTYIGSCHCKFITYSASIDFTLSGFTKCNCGICQKAGYLIANPLPGSFQLKTPLEGEAALKDYQFGPKSVHHFFCPHCGVRCFLRGTYEDDGKTHEFLNVNAVTLDEKEGPDKEMEDFCNIKTTYVDGRTGNWEPLDKPYKGGVW